jgi:energy-coupling factor transporter transmembrane protein EcfT
LAGLGALIVAALAARRLSILLTLFLLAIPLALFSRIPLRLLATRVWLSVLAFTGLVALPALFLAPQGAVAAAFLLLRAETIATFLFLLLLSTLWNRLLRALRFFRIPAVAVAILAMTYRYIFLFLENARSMLEARESRALGPMPPSEQRRLAVSTAGVLLDKTFQLGAEVHAAMLARGFRGEVRLLDDLRMTAAGWLQLAAFLSAAFIAVWLGR